MTDDPRGDSLGRIESLIAEHRHDGLEADALGYDKIAEFHAKSVDRLLDRWLTVAATPMFST